MDQGNPLRVRTDEIKKEGKESSEVRNCHRSTSG